MVENRYSKKGLFQMKHFLYIIIIFAFFISCKTEDEKLTLGKRPYSGNEIRLDGCYISEPTHNGYCSYMFFYANGILFNLGDVANINNLDEFSKNAIDSQKNYKLCWSVFHIENHDLITQGWQEGGWIYVQYVIKNKTYIILNDTTLYENVENNDTTFLHFKRFSPKPDSTNIFIK
jgi:hypothetical protein